MKPTFDYSSVFKIGSHGLVSLVVSGFIANVAVAAPASNALPTGGAVVSGNVNIATNAATMNINQASSKSVINWQTYNIGSAATVNYNFAQSGSSSLNRVLSNNPSEIYGKLNANGKVILVNPNGIVFGSGSSVNVGSLVATTMNIKDADYLNDKLIFTRDGSIGKILNEGAITAEDKGYIALLAPEVVNKGVIKAVMGSVSMAAGEKIELTLDNSGLKTVMLEPSTVKTLIDNKALIEAKGGVVYLGAKEASAILDTVMNLKNSGIVEATAMNSVSGKIILDGDNIEVDGTLKATEVYAGNKNNAKTLVKATATLEGEFVETSGKVLGVENGAKVKAKKWLLDPVDINIVDGGAGAVDGTDAQLSVDASTVETALGSGDVLLEATNDINVNEALTWSANGLTLSAGNNIAINANMTATGTGSLALYYGQGAADGGSSSYTVADGVDVLIPSAGAFTWKKGSAGTVNNLVFNNNKIRFGDGTEESLTSYGTLKQPWYYDEPRSDSYNSDDWFPLTYDESSGYPLDIQIATGGDGTNTWNHNGTRYTTDEGTYNPVTSQFNISKYYEGHGTIVSTVTLDGSTQVKNTYTLTQSDMYLKTITEVKNIHSMDTLTNVRVWVGTRDDYIATNDDPSKTKGNLTSNGFQAITDQNTQAKALKITENEDGTGAAVLFYSTSANADIAFSDCCSFSNATSIDPRSSAIYIDQDDGSYAMFMRMSNLAPGQSESMSWYYAAGPVSQLDNIVSQVSSSAGVAPSTPPSVTPPTTTQTPTTNSPVEVVVSQIADNVVKNVEKTVVAPQTTTPNVVAATSQVVTPPSVVQVVQPVGNEGSTTQGGAIVNTGGSTQISLAVAANANPFASNENISVLSGGVKVASAELPSDVKSDVKPASIVGNAPASMVVVKQLAPQKGVELAIVAPSTNTADSKVAAKITTDTVGGFSFTVKEAVNVNVAQKDIKEVKATLDNGQALPAWLQFDAKTQTFKAVNPPANALPISTKVSITTKAGQTQQIAVEIAK